MSTNIQWCRSRSIRSFAFTYHVAWRFSEPVPVGRSCISVLELHLECIRKVHNRRSCV